MLRSNAKTERSQRIPKTSQSPSHSHTYEPASPDIYIRRGRAQCACGGIVGMGGEVRLCYLEVVNTVRQYLHGSQRAALRHLTPLRLFVQSQVA